MTTATTTDAPAHFSRWQIRLHWLTLLAIALAYGAIEAKGLIPKGMAAHDIVKRLHFDFGALVWVLMLVRLGLRLRGPGPAIVPAPPRWQAAAARLAHGLLYVTFLALPVLGVLALAYGGRQWSLFGLAVPDFVTPDRATGRTLKEIHEAWAEAGYFFIGLHAAAALLHHYVRRDSTLLGMMPAHWAARGRRGGIS